VAEATISADAHVNQTVQADTQVVEVSAATTMDLLNLAGQLKLELEPISIKNNLKRKNSPISPLATRRPGRRRRFGSGPVGR